MDSENCATPKPSRPDSGASAAEVVIRTRRTSMIRLPPWIRTRLASNDRNAVVQRTLAQTRLNTVCERALCPNRNECFGCGTATVLIMGNTCTRRCRFCAIRSGTPDPLDPDEPRRVADLAAKLGLKHVVVTSVTRDDLPDGGASAFAETIAALKRLPCVSVEVLTPDFLGCRESISAVLEQRPDVFNHNLETIRSLQSAIRPQAGYERSLGVLRAAAARSPALRVKSGLMVGLGETDEELLEAIRDIFDTGCRYLTIGQYLAPSKRHAPVARYVHPKTFDEYREKALEMGFRAVVSGPMVRSSYHAENMLESSQRDYGAERER